MAARLAFQLQRLEAMQNVSQTLLERPRLGEGFFARGMPEQVKIDHITTYNTSLFDLLRAYGNIKQREVGSSLRIAPTALYSMDQAVQRLRSILGDMPDWRTLETYLPDNLTDPLIRRSAVASTFAATLELVREGILDVQQTGSFAPIMIRKAPVRRYVEGSEPVEEETEDSAGETSILDELDGPDEAEEPAV